MFCNNCGKEVIENSKFCNHCGSKILFKKSVKEKSIALKKISIESPKVYVWTCDYCDEEFNSKNESGKHEEVCEKNPKNIKDVTKVICSKCGIENTDEAKFCKKCGNEISIEKRDYAGFWVRMGAWLIDYVGIILFAFILAIAYLIFGYNSSNMEESIDIILTYIYMIIYFTFFIAIFGTTPGKRIYGLKVVNEDGSKLSWGASFKRAFMQPFSCFLFGIGYNNMNRNGKQQAWHDRETHSLVLKKDGVNYFFPIILSILGLFVYMWIRSSAST